MKLKVHICFEFVCTCLPPCCCYIASVGNQYDQTRELIVAQSSPKLPKSGQSSFLRKNIDFLNSTKSCPTFGQILLENLWPIFFKSSPIWSHWRRERERKNKNRAIITSWIWCSAYLQRVQNFPPKIDYIFHFGRQILSTLPPILIGLHRLCPNFDWAVAPIEPNMWEKNQPKTRHLGVRHHRQKFY